MKTELERVEPRPARRRFLQGAAALAATLIAPGVFLFKSSHATDAATRSPRWGLLIDTNAMSEADVDACVQACQREHGWHNRAGSKTDAQWIRKVGLSDPQSGHRRFLPMMCQHCENPPCVDVCPTGASFKRADGIVLVNRHICIGCRYCMMACPYKARSFVHEMLEDQKSYAPRGKGTVESCTMCVHRVDADELPACVEACSDTGGGAMLFGDLNGPDSEISQRVAKYASQQIRADLGLDPGVRYQNL